MLETTPEKTDELTSGVNTSVGCTVMFGLMSSQKMGMSMENVTKVQLHQVTIVNKIDYLGSE